MLEKQIEEMLGIRTTGRDASRADSYNYPYEPTDYRVLKRLAQSGFINKKSYLIDYGSGKGRVSFYLSYETGCKCTGVEYDERLFQIAQRNLNKYPLKNKVDFVCENAVNFNIEANVNCFYFFNPFSVEILSSIIGKIIKSYYENPRKMYLFFYYPSMEYAGYLMQENDLYFIDEVECDDIFPDNNEKVREVIMIFGIGEE